MKQLLPGCTIGILGGGQLGRMLVQAAARMGYEAAVFSPQASSPAGRLAGHEVVAEYEDEKALRDFASLVDVVTIEFENIPPGALELLQQRVPVRPGPLALHTAQHRGREKAFLAANGLPHAPTKAVAGVEEFETALRGIGTPAILKTAGFGYDGKGQLLIQGAQQRDEALRLLQQGPGVLERVVEFVRELSVIVARSPNGEIATYPLFENLHRERILDLTSVPARVSEATESQATEIAHEVAARLELEGLACIELFELESGELLVNELAPRPHNSGHLTIEACPVSQFEQQLRAVCGLPLGATAPYRPAAMANLLGELWAGGEPDWSGLLQRPGVALHLYGKGEARPGRKMGHLTVVAESAGQAARAVEAARDSLRVVRSRPE